MHQSKPKSGKENSDNYSMMKLRSWSPRSNLSFIFLKLTLVLCRCHKPQSQLYQLQPQSMTAWWCIIPSKKVPALSDNLFYWSALNWKWSIKTHTKLREQMQDNMKVWLKTSKRFNFPVCTLTYIVSVQRENFNNTPPQLTWKLIVHFY